MSEQQHTPWGKSSYSGPSGEACVETRKGIEAGAVTAVDVRDSKDTATSPVITFSPDAWAGFVAGMTV